MHTYSTIDVAGLLDLSPARVRRLAESASLNPDREDRHHYRFSFQDLVLLRTALELENAGISAFRIHRALRELKLQLPSGRPLTAVRIMADGENVFVDDGRTTWDPDSGQVQFDFAVSDLAERVRPLDRRAAKAIRNRDRELDADDWYELGCALEISSPGQAMEAFRRVIDLRPEHADARVNLGYLLHEAGDLPAAETLYLEALEAEPSNGTAAYNLGVVREDAKRPKDAIAAYLMAIEIDKTMADAHFNLSRLYEDADDRSEALKHLVNYRELNESR